ncbi:hypothetical protein, partial [Promineifilum sp.]|uniref:hypothetical protein n=1 Tax=Promineifilum sp. TaxID=2664178 RepID=UPI0035B17E16
HVDERDGCGVSTDWMSVVHGLPRGVIRRLGRLRKEAHAKVAKYTKNAKFPSFALFASFATLA